MTLNWPPDTAVWRPYTQMKTAPPALEIVATEGVRLHLADGRVLLDGIASWWTACHGYNHPHIRAAVTEQLNRMPHVMFGGLTHAPAERLAQRLAGIAPGDLDHVFFTDSGSVAVEVALKIAVQYWLNQGVGGRHRFLAFRHGYHGDTLGAMAVCDPDSGMHAALNAYIPQQIICDLPETAESRGRFGAILAEFGPSLAGVILEPLVQGAGGMKFHSAETLGHIAAQCRQAGVLLILDEIMTGFGRTGPLFAADAAGIVPDILCLSKALTGGTLPLAATLVRTPIFEAFWSDRAAAALMHGPTFMANPLACAAANASLDLFEQAGNYADRLTEIEALLRAGLSPCRGLPGIQDVRAKGAIGVVELREAGDGNWLKQELINAGVWVRPLGNILYLAPAFVMNDTDLVQLCEAVCRVASAWSARFGS